MFENVRALIVVVALAVPAFYILGQITGPLVPRREFVIWRNAWFVVTVAAFLSIQFFAFTVFLVLVCVYVRSVHAGTAGIFFVLLFAVPLVDVPIGGGGIQLLLAINNGRMLAIFLLLPMLFEKRQPSYRNGVAFVAADWLIVSYTLLEVALQFRRAELTSVLRVLVTNTLDILIPYFAFSRTITNLSDFRRVVFGFLVAALPIALMAPFELAKGWHLYAVVANDWGAGRYYVWRDGLLRAEGPANGAIILGYLIMVAIGCVLVIWRDTTVQRRYVTVILIILAAGLVVSLSRGPWVGCFVLIAGFLAIGPHAVVNLGRLAVALAMAFVTLLLLPSGQKLLNLLPFVGTVEVATVTYRQQLFENALAVIERNPWIGSADYLSTPEMQAMLQGEGIVDTVNTFLEIALGSGVVGLSLFVGIFLVIIARLWRVAKSDLNNRSGLGNYARASAAILLAILVTIATVSSIDFIPYVYWSFAGLCVALVRISSGQPTAARHEDVVGRSVDSMERGAGLVGIASAVRWRIGDRGGRPGGEDHR